MAAGKRADQKLPVEIGNKLQIINQVSGSLSADNSQVKKVHYKRLALLQIFSCMCVQYIIKLLPLTYFKRMPLPTGTSAGSTKIAKKQTQTLSLYQMGGDFRNFRRWGGFRIHLPQNKGILAKKHCKSSPKTLESVSRVDFFFFFLT